MHVLGQQYASCEQILPFTDHAFALHCYHAKDIRGMMITLKHKSGHRGEQRQWHRADKNAESMAETIQTCASSDSCRDREGKIQNRADSTPHKALKASSVAGSAVSSACMSPWQLLC